MRREPRSGTRRPGRPGRLGRRVLGFLYRGLMLLGAQWVPAVLDPELRVLPTTAPPRLDEPPRAHPERLCPLPPTPVERELWNAYYAE